MAGESAHISAQMMFKYDEAMLKVFREDLAHLIESEVKFFVVRGTITYRAMRVLVEGFRAFYPDVPIVYDPWVEANAIFIVEGSPA